MFVGGGVVRNFNVNKLLTTFPHATYMRGTCMQRVRFVFKVQNSRRELCLFTVVLAMSRRTLLDCLSACAALEE